MRVDSPKLYITTMQCSLCRQLNNKPRVYSSHRCTILAIVYSFTKSIKPSKRKFILDPKLSALCMEMIARCRTLKP